MNRSFVSEQFLTLAVAAGVLAAGAASAQPSQYGQAGWQPEMSALAMASGETDIDSGGSFSTSRWYLEPGASFQAGPAGGFGVSVGFGQTFYDFEGANGLTDSMDVNEISVSVPMRIRVSDSAFALVVPRISYTGESGASFDDASTAGLLGSVAWRVSPNLILGPGVGVFTTLEDDLQAIPFLLIDWSITDRLSLSTGRGLAASRGPGLTLSYQATDAWAFGVIGRYEEFDFRLDDDHETSEGTITDRSIPVVATTTWTPSDQIAITGFAGYAYGGKLTVYDSDGDKVGQSDYDPAPVFGLSARLAF